MTASLRDPLLANTAFKSQTGHEVQHWGNVKRSLQDCQEVLESLEKILENVQKTDSGFLRRPRNIVKMSSGQLTQLHQQVASYTRTMQLSLQLITVYVFSLGVSKFT